MAQSGPRDAVGSSGENEDSAGGAGTKVVATKIT